MGADRMAQDHDEARARRLRTWTRRRRIGLEDLIRQNVCPANGVTIFCAAFEPVLD